MNLHVLADKVSLFFQCVRRIDLKHTLKLTYRTTFPYGLVPVSLLFSPITFPCFFVLRLYEQYCIEKFILHLKKLTDLLDSVLGPIPTKENANVPGSLPRSQNFFMFLVRLIGKALDC